MSHTIQCYLCKNTIYENKFDQHLEQCFQDKGDKEEIKYANLNKLQKKVIKYSNKKAKVYSDGVKKLLLIKIVEWGYTKQDYKDLRKYFRELFPVVHIKPSHMKFFIDDTHYRSLFEIGVSGGSNSVICRSKWETNLFGGLYDNCDPKDRVKYGVINLLNAKSGVNNAHIYGKCHFILKKNTRNRITMTHGDSCIMQYHLGNYKYFEHILYYLPDSVLKIVLSDFRKGVCQQVNYAYIEFQLHGDLRFDRDIEELVVPLASKDDPCFAEFCSKYNIKISHY